MFGWCAVPLQPGTWTMQVFLVPLPNPDQDHAGTEPQTQHAITRPINALRLQLLPVLPGAMTAGSVSPQSPVMPTNSLCMGTGK
jgi:hypothetical protein